jgi:hypothetical protein
MKPVDRYTKNKGDPNIMDYEDKLRKKAFINTINALNFAADQYAPKPQSGFKLGDHSDPTIYSSRPNRAINEIQLKSIMDTFDSPEEFREFGIDQIKKRTIERQAIEELLKENPSIAFPPDQA